MIKKNTIVTVKIEGVTAKGFGIARVEDFVLFTEGGLTGDMLSIQVIKVKKTYGYGRILKILTPSPHRIESPCPISQKCGGCQWQNCDYKAQLGFKTDIVKDALARIGGLSNAPVADVIGMDNPQPYRNKAVFPIVPTEGGGFEIGMYAPRSHRIIPVEVCAIQHPAHVEVLKVLRRHMGSYNISAYDETAHKGIMRYVIVRTSKATGEIMVVLVVNGNGVPMEEELAEALTNAGAATIVINRHRARGNTIMGDGFRVVTGEGFIRERIGQVWYQLSAPSFFQINPVQAEALYNIAVEFAGLTGSEHVLDAHVGVGGVALQAAGKAKEVVGVDIVAEAIADAAKNAEINDIGNAKFVRGAAEEVIPEMLKSGVAPDVVFLDPPRKGCEKELLDGLVAAEVATIVYISCDPATLARDVKILAEGGYKLTAAQPVDMFPMTGKVEVCCKLVKVE
ncbi:MAG: 23S rRNA (uracil(1939)-C(5))-methyltransferase RlmD [Defluviitaleaceae bacterium]|nr:23S rRNA (uracil(1939)-C(5))-methyltransferase RlmD [Defluviitaleaceae bacterium]